LKPIRIYTDGGCDKNPGGTGGWAVRLLNGDQVIERSGRVENTTNNRMELTAAIRALELLDEYLAGEEGRAVIYTDSQYLSRGMNEWVPRWVLGKWRLKDGSPVKNADLWQRLIELEYRHPVTWTWVQGHAGDPDNTRVDQLVQAAMKGQPTPRGTEAEAGADIPPEVKLIRRWGRPAAVSIAARPGSKGVRVEWSHLQGLIEKLIEAQRKGEET